MAALKLVGMLVISPLFRSLVALTVAVSVTFAVPFGVLIFCYFRRG
ncbi:MAG: hypothetical protein V1885_03165 [Candidatus Brennerbacteria bacterium]